MSFKHTFKANVNWKLGEGSSTINPRRFSRKHMVTIDDKYEPLQMSAARMFRGDETHYNPEDLLLSALASCHMMSYLYVCAQNSIEVLSYTDNAEAILEVASIGSGRFIKVMLYPVVVIKDESQKEMALSLHVEANKLCFIANSCNFPIEHYAQIISSII